MKNLIYAVVLALAAVSVSAHGHHDHPPPPPEVREACEGDRDNFCAGLEHKELRECMREHRNELSDGCIDAWKTWKESLPHHGPPQEIVEACADDKAQFCDGLERKKLRKCMKQNWGSLSGQCQDAIKKFGKHHGHHGGHHHPKVNVPEEVKEACHDDRKSYCGHIKKPRKHPMKVLKCMKNHWGDLSEECQDAFIAWGKNKDPTIVDGVDNQEEMVFAALEQSVNEASSADEYNSRDGHDGGHHKFVHIAALIAGVAVVAVVVKVVVMKIRAKKQAQRNSLAATVEGGTVLADDADTFDGIPVGIVVE